MKIRFALFLLFFLPFFGQAQNLVEFPGYYIPKNVDEALFHLSFTWSKDQQMAFKNKPEEKAVAEQYFFAGLDMRNNWRLWSGSRLADYFKANGVYHPDDMSTVILRSFHRNLNRKEIDLEGQLQYHREYWEFIDYQYTESEKRVARNFNSIQLADTVEMSFFISGEAYGKPQIQLTPPAEKPDSVSFENPGCKLKGVVLKKDHYDKTYKLFIKLTNVCQLEEVYYGHEKLQAGSIMNFDLNYHNWQKSLQ